MSILIRNSSEPRHEHNGRTNVEIIGIDGEAELWISLNKSRFL